MSFSVGSDNRLYEDGSLVKYHTTRNASRRWFTPIGIVVHGTFGNPFNISGSIAWNQRVDIRGRGSAQVYIDRDGVAHGMNTLNQVLWHAGTSRWKPKGWKGFLSGLNKRYIGIELACAGPLDKISETLYRPKWDRKKTFKIDLKAHPGATVSEAIYAKYPNDKYWLDYTKPQIETLIKVCPALEAKWQTIDECITHHDCAPRRKKDCAPTLDMIKLNKAVFDDADFFADDPFPPSPVAREPYVASSQVAGLTITEAKQAMFDLGFRITDVKSPVVGKTVRASLLELQDDNGLPLSGEFDVATLSLLASGKAIKKSDTELDKLTVAELRERGSSTIAEADNDERMGVAVPAVLVGIKGADTFFGGQWLSGFSSMAGSITKLLQPFGVKLSAMELLLGTALLCVSGYLMARAALRKRKRVADAKSGKKPR